MNIFQRKYYNGILGSRPPQRPVAAVPQIDACENVCFLYRYVSENQMAQDWEVMKRFHNNFYVLLYYEGKPYQGQFFNKLNVIPLSAERFNFFGRLSADVLSNLQSKRYDLLLNTMDIMDERMAVLHQWVHSDFKIGRNKEYACLNDLSLLLRPEDDLQSYLEHVRNYTEKLNG